MPKIEDIINEVELKKFFHNFNGKKYIYGTGKYGEVCACIVEKLNFKFSAFIVSQKGNNFFHDHKVYPLDELQDDISESDCILLAMKEEFQNEVINNLPPNFSGVVGRLNRNLFDKYRDEEVGKFLSELAEKYPPKPYCGDEDIKDILVVRLDRMGDMIWTSAFFRELRRNYPEGKITALIGSKNYGILQCCPYIDEIIGCDYEQWLQKDSSFRSLYDCSVNYIKSEMCLNNYDMVFTARELSYEGNMIINTFLSVLVSNGIRVANNMHYKSGMPTIIKRSMSRLYSVISEYSHPMHEVEKIMGMLPAIGCNVKRDNLEVWFPKEILQTSNLCKKIKKIRNEYRYMVAVGLTSQDPNRTWDIKSYEEVFESMAKVFDVCFILLGDHNTQQYLAEISFPLNCIDLTGKTNLHELMQVVDISDIYLGSNTGIMHIAAALSKPVIEISAHFSWGDDCGVIAPKRCGAWKTKYVVLSPEIPKSEACARAGYCISKTSHCINNVSVDSVCNVLTGFFRYYEFSSKFE